MCIDILDIYSIVWLAAKSSLLITRPSDCVGFIGEEKKQHQFTFGRIFIGRRCEIVGARLIAFHCKKKEKSVGFEFNLIPRFSEDT